MATVATTFQTYQAKGIREQLSDDIYNLSPTQTPFISNAGRGSAQNTFFEWQQDTLAAASTSNAQIEGDDQATYTAVVPTLRLGNWTQIARKPILISGTEEVVNKAGRDSEMAYQVAKQTKEIKRDMEAGMLAAQVGTAGNATAARYTGGPLAWVKTNVDMGASGANSTSTTQPTSLRTDGTQRAFTEAILKNVLQLCFTNGATPKMVMVGAVNKQNVSAFSGIATRTLYQTEAERTAIIGAADVYVSDFGKLQIVPNRFQRSRDAWVLDPAMIQVNYLRPFNVQDMAKTGDATKKSLIVEYGLKLNHEAGIGLAADLL